MRALLLACLLPPLAVLCACPDNPPRDDAGLPALCADAGSSPACPLAPPVIGDPCEQAVTCFYCDERDQGQDGGTRSRWCDGLTWNVVAAEE